MSPRPYRMARRQESTSETRLVILSAARSLLAEGNAAPPFSLEEVARRAGVARMTVYHHFGSFQGLIAGLCDSLAAAGGMDHLADAFRRADPYEALDEFVAVFARFWETDRAVLRGLRAMAVLDREIARELERRAGWRRKGLQRLLARITREAAPSKTTGAEDVVDLVHALTDFGIYDSLATAARGTEQVTAMLQRLVRQMLS